MRINFSNLYIKTKVLEQVNRLDEGLKDYFLNQISLLEAGKGEAAATGFDILLQAAKKAEAEAAAAKKAGQTVDPEAIIKKIETPSAQTIPADAGVARAETPVGSPPPPKAPEPPAATTGAKAAETATDAATASKRAADNQLFRQAEADSMSKLEKMKDVAKKIAVPAAVVAGAATLTGDTNRDRQDASAQTSPAAEEPGTKYKVVAGDTLSQLAQKNKVSVADIAKANDLKDIHKINVGQELVIPKATGNQIYKYNVGTESGPKSSKDIKSLLQKQENRDRVNESLLAAFNEIVSSKHPNLFAEAAKKGSVPKTEKEKSLAALAEPKDKITHKDVLVGRGVVKEEEVGFSEAELAHIASIVEGTPIAPSPKKYAPNGSDKTNATGSKSGTLSDSNEEVQVTEAKVGRKSEEESLGDNMLHMNAKKAADNMANVKHKFASGEVVNMTKGMAVGFLNRHSSAKTADQKDAILKHANKSLDSFKSVVSGDKIPEPEKPSIKLGSMKGK